MQIIHLGTKLQTTFAVLHESGDATDPLEFSFALPSLSAQAFAALVPHIESKRQEMAEKAVAVYQGQSPDVAEPPPGG